MSRVEVISTPEVSGPLKRILRTAASFAAKIVLVCFVLPILYLIEPFWRIRVTHFGVDRIGNLSGDMQLYWAERELGRNLPRTTEILIGGNPCNWQLMVMWKRLLPIFDGHLVSIFWHYTKDVFRRTRFDT